MGIVKPKSGVEGSVGKGDQVALVSQLTLGKPWLRVRLILGV